MTERIWHLDWAHGKAQVHALGAMLGPLIFRLPGGREIQPMHVAPWIAEGVDHGLTGLMSGLRGEWPCVPFGATEAPLSLPPDWQTRRPDNLFNHGFGAHHDWRLQEARAGYLALFIDYPENSPVARIEREIQTDPTAPALILSLRVHARRETTLPLAIHPTFRLPQQAHALRISLGSPERILNYPVAPEAGISLLRPDSSSAGLQQMQGKDGLLDLSSLPLPVATEELVQAMNCRGPVHLDYLQEAARISLDWDRKLLPDVMLWISNGGRRHAPWNGRHFALGVEPLAGPFDLGRVATPPAAHPLAQRMLNLYPDEPLVLKYRIAASPLAPADSAA